jgi:hypothetical protein
MRKLNILAGLLLLAAAQARAADTTPSAYRRVMQAQYAASTPVKAATPEEAQRIYEAYLRSIGRPAKDPSTDTGKDAGIPSR